MPRPNGDIETVKSLARALVKEKDFPPLYKLYCLTLLANMAKVASIPLALHMQPRAKTEAPLVPVLPPAPADPTPTPVSDEDIQAAIRRLDGGANGGA